MPLARLCDVWLHARERVRIPRHPAGLRQLARRPVQAAGHLLLAGPVQQPQLSLLQPLRRKPVKAGQHPPDIR